ncbi:MAG: TonB-dependent receptor [Acidobacteria bacterium]|nr:TonB-dependent receptor [Acidobacteriota bacterium]MBV9144440.1 TonB-dependent receptor [Acidobacteriota bacterium]
MFLGALSAALAQLPAAGSIEGSVTDPTGAVIVGASVVARSVTAGAAFKTTTDNDGLFRVLVLEVGTYELRIEHDGFTPLIDKEVVVTVGAGVSIALKMTVAGGAESISVTSSPLIEDTRTQLSTTIENQFISKLPVNGRDFSKFVLLAPGITRDARGGLSVGGQRVMNSLVVDGTNNDNTFFGVHLGGTGFSAGANATFHISQEAVQEFQVNTNAYSAELGRAGGAVINAVTKSGGNDLHGTAFWFYRDRSLNANDPVNKLNDLPKDPFHFNQFGGVVGGPVRKNRLFFLLNYEGLRSNSPNAVVLNLPLRFQFSPNQTVAAFQKLAINYLGARAAPWTEPFTIDDSLAKLDWQINPSHHFDLRWNHESLSEDFVTGQQNSFEHTTPDVDHDDVISASLTSVLSPSLVNTARFAFVHEASPFLANGHRPEANVFEAGQLVLSIGTGPNVPEDAEIHRTQWVDTVALAHGHHALKFGEDVMLDRITFRHSETFAGTYRFNSLESFGRSLAGAPVPIQGDSYQQSFAGDGSNESVTHPDILLLAGFAQDEWHPRPRLTMNLGLRYDLQVTPNPPVRNPAALAAGLDTSTLPTDEDNIAPRVGFAWMPLRSQRFVLRGGYGIFYAITPAEMTARAFFQNGVSVQTRALSAATPLGAALIPAYPNTLCGPPPSSGAIPGCLPPVASASNQILELFARSFEQPYVQQGSFGWEAQLSTNSAIEASYLFSKGTHLPHVRDINLGLPSATLPIGIAGTPTVLSYQRFSLPRPISTFNRVLQFTSSGNSIYHGLVVQATKRFSSNYSFLASYTLSKVIDDNPNVFAIRPNPSNAMFLSDPTNPRADRGPGANDQRHRLVVSGIWELNHAKHLSGASRAVLEGWQVSAILTAETGQPYSGLVGFDLNNDGNFATDRVPGLGRDTFYLPASISLDPRLTRTVRLRDRLQLQMMFEAFNAFNHSNITRVRTTEFAVVQSPASCGIAGSPCLVRQNTQTAGLDAFGTPTASSGARILQFGAKLIF